MFNPDLPSNHMIFAVRRDPETFPSFAQRLEELMEQYGLSDAEKTAWRNEDIRALADLGVHSYFLPQATRLLKGSEKNDSSSEAAAVFRRTMVDS